MDQLSGLLQRFPFSAQVFFNGEFCGSNYFSRDEQVGHLHLVRRGPLVMHHDNQASIHVDAPALVFYPRGMNHRLHVPAGTPAQLLCAAIRFEAGAQNALTRALPECLKLPFNELPRLGGTFDLLFDEAHAPQHGRQAVLDRLCEVLTIQVVRHVAETGRLSAGTLAGLADDGLSRALEALHGDPAQPWSVERLAQVSGMSRSKFAKRFHDIVGATPVEYMTDWRMRLAQGLLKKNKSVKVAAAAAGYGSQPAFTKAFTAKFGLSPRAWLDNQARGDKPPSVSKDR